ncbi:guanylate-binding protein 4-like [Ptychodera flava]|uniref:guanylate-binding protein 4-like n=1 Tax=Ptychodera flava TaxID=63121 RepID=UPI00396A5483
MGLSDKTPKCVPLCYPGNYKWDKAKGKLVEKEKKREQLVVCEDAMEIIRSIDGPICTVAVTGPARSGKSYIARIWMSTDVFKKTLSNGTEVTVIILDTEGLDAHNAYKKDDMLLFALMALMSSVLVYNSSNTVRAEDLNKLSWVNRYIKVFSWSGSSRKKTTLLENEFIKFFPNFMWLLRAVTMSFVISQDDEDVLKQEMEEDTTEGVVTERNATRRALLKSFPVLDALTLSTPSIEKSVLEEMDKGENKGSLSKTFLADIDVFITRCGTLMKPKKAWPHDGNINGHQFANMLQQYVSRFSETEVINVDAVVPSVIEEQLQQVVDLVFTDYRHDMDEYAKTALPCKNYEIIEKHNDCMYQAMRKFKENAKCINDADSLQKYRDALKEELARYRDGDIVGG